jgi:cell division protein FtsL
MSEKGISYYFEVLKQSEFISFFKNWFAISRWQIIAIVLISALFVSFIVNHRFTIVKLVNEIEQLRKEKQLKINEVKVLEAELIKLQNGIRISEIAESKIGMTRTLKSPIEIK